MSEIRKASCNEHLYMDMQDLTNSYAIQYLFKIKKFPQAYPQMYTLYIHFYINDKYDDMDKITVVFTFVESHPILPSFPQSEPY